MMLFQLLISLLFFGSDDKPKNRLIINRIPFGQVEQPLVSSFFYFPLDKFTTKWEEGKIKMITWDQIRFTKPEIKPSYFNNLNKSERFQRYQPFKAIKWAKDFDSLNLYLKSVGDVLSNFKDTLVLQDLDEISMREGKFTATTATQFYDPRPFFGSQVVVDFQRLFFFTKVLRKFHLLTAQH